MIVDILCCSEDVVKNMIFKKKKVKNLETLEKYRLFLKISKNIEKCRK